MRAEDVVEGIAQGVRNALATSEFLLGAEAITFERPSITPEYLVTIEVAKQLSDPERRVVLECHMDDLRNAARTNATLRERLVATRGQDTTVQRQPIPINATCAKPAFQFGRKGNGKKRIDIVVFSSSHLELPLLIAEAKLGSQSPQAIIADIDRVATLLQMHHELGLGQSLYGAVFFYRMRSGASIEGVRKRAGNLLGKIDAHLMSKKSDPDFQWLKARADLLHRGSRTEEVQAYEEGDGQMFFARRGYAFAPGLVLLGSSSDVETVVF